MGHTRGDMASTEKRRAYWRRNLRYLTILLSIWFVVSYGCGILFVDELNQIRVGGFKLGFWFAQQGSIYVFVALIFIYVRLMNRLDEELIAGGSSPARATGDSPGASSSASETAAASDEGGDQKAGG